MKKETTEIKAIACAPNLSKRPGLEARPKPWKTERARNKRARGSSVKVRINWGNMSRLIQRVNFDER